MTAVAALRMIESWPHRRRSHSTSWSSAQDPPASSRRSARPVSAPARRWSPATSSGGWPRTTGPVPVRTLAQAARLIREARQLPLYGIAGGEPVARLSPAAGACPRRDRGRTPAHAAARRSGACRGDHLRAGRHARFADAHTVESDNAPRLEAGKVIICTGGDLAAAVRSRLRLDRDAQRRVAPFLGAAVAARDRRWRDRRAGGIDLQRVRLTRPSR